MFHRESERLAGRLRQLYSHIVDLQIDVSSIGLQLQMMQSQIEESLKRMSDAGHVAPIEHFQELATAGLTEDEKHHFHRATDGYHNISPTYMTFFCSIAGGIITAMENGAMSLPDVLFASYATREVEAIILAGDAHIDDIMSGNADCISRLGKLEDALRVRLTSRASWSLHLDEDKTAHGLYVWCQWCRSIGLSMNNKIQELADLPLEQQIEQLVRAIHFAQMARYCLIHVRRRARHFIQIFAHGIQKSHEIQDEKIVAQEAAREWVNALRNRPLTVDRASLVATMKELDQAEWEGGRSWLEDDIDLNETRRRSIDVINHIV